MVCYGALLVHDGIALLISTSMTLLRRCLGAARSTRGCASAAAGLPRHAGERRGDSQYTDRYVNGLCLTCCELHSGPQWPLVLARHVPSIAPVVASAALTAQSIYLRGLAHSSLLFTESLSTELIFEEDEFQPLGAALALLTQLKRATLTGMLAPHRIGISASPQA